MRQQLYCMAMASGFGSFDSYVVINEYKLTINLGLYLKCFTSTFLSSFCLCLPSPLSINEFGLGLATIGLDTVPIIDFRIVMYQRFGLNVLSFDFLLSR